MKLKTSNKLHTYSNERYSYSFLADPFYSLLQGYSPHGKKD